MLRSFRSVLCQGFGRYVRDPVHHYVTDLALIDQPQELFGRDAQFACRLRARRRVLSAIATSIGAEFQLTVEAADLDLDLGEFGEVIGRPKSLSGLLLTVREVYSRHPVGQGSTISSHPSGSERALSVRRRRLSVSDGTATAATA